MPIKKPELKLIREIKEIIDNPDLHLWIKCKCFTQVKTYNRPDSEKGRKLIREFFKTCAGKYKDRFDSAYVRPYLDSWWGDRSYDHVNGIDLNKDESAMLGRNPRGIKLIRKLGSSERFENYLVSKYPEAFEKFEEIKKVNYTYYSATEKTSDRAWQHIFFQISRRCFFRSNDSRIAEWITPKDIQMKRRELDLAMEKAQADYKKLKRASKLPPRYLYNEVSLAELQLNHKNHTYAIFNGNYITTETVLNYDNSEVHHGIGKLVRTDRRISISDFKGRWFTAALKTYAGNFVLNKIEEWIGKIKRLKVPAELKPVQLNPKMEVVEIAKSKGFRVFRRLFAGTHYDYCVLCDGTTYHDSSIEKCMAGWKKKKELSKAGSKIFNMKILRSKFGFCRIGITNFCSANNLDSHETYTLTEIKLVVNKNISYNKSYYGRELKQIGVL